MRFQLAVHGWPVDGGAKLIPVGTILDSEDWTWNGLPLRWPPPVNAMALDQEAYDELIKHHEYHSVLSSPGDPNIRRHGDK